MSYDLRAQHESLDGGVGQWSGWSAGFSQLFGELAKGYGAQQAAGAERSRAAAEAARARAELLRAKAQSTKYTALQSMSGWPTWAVAGVVLAGGALAVVMLRRRRRRRS